MTRKRGFGPNTPKAIRRFLRRHLATRIVRIPTADGGTRKVPVTVEHETVVVKVPTAKDLEEGTADARQRADDRSK